MPFADLDWTDADWAAFEARQKARDKRTPAAKRSEHKRARAKRRELGLPREVPRRERAFVGVDGEGAGEDAEGRQNYRLLRAGDHAVECLDSLRTRLTTTECLEFLCSLPRNRVYVGFSFGYDATQICRDLGEYQLDRIFLTDRDKDRRGLPRFRYTYFGAFGIEYVPRQYFRVCRLRSRRDGSGGLETIPLSSRTVYETFGFFQCSFLKALSQFSIATPAELARIEANKNARDRFKAITPEIRRYNALECDLLARLMERFRDVCDAGGLKPKTWNGAGKLAAALHRDHATLRKDDTLGEGGAVIRRGLASLVPGECMDYARAAYYGGRFEVTQIGRVEGPIHEYDIRSAYPAAMLRLPCLEHGRWTACEGPTDGLYVASVSYSHPAGSPLCGLPYRSPQHRLSWQRQGRGVYWSVEIEAARELGATVEPGSAWCFEPGCDCQPFAWVRELYDYRRALGAAQQGIPVKLGINSLYGQLARRIGDGGPWQNHLWAGLITAHTRAALMRAAASSPADVVMLATDAIYSRAPLHVAPRAGAAGAGLTIGEGLGEWEHAVHPGMFVVQPGLYWGPPKPKTRGIPLVFFDRHRDRFERAWTGFVRAQQAGAACPPPIVTVPLRNFIGLKLACSRGKPATAGCWRDEERAISFNWKDKRELGSARLSRDAILTRPHAGHPSLISHVYTWDADFASMAQELGSLTEGLPDFLDFSAPGF